jgi:NADH dehydrogenase subunit A (EC 1.6.5.3)
MAYIGLLSLLAVMLGLSVVLVSLNWLLGPKKKEPYKTYPYECGVPLYDDTAQTTFHQGYYILGLLLLLFDIEVAYLFPWAVVYNYLGIFGFIEVFLFLLILTFGLVYAWKKEALDWQFDLESL